MNILLTGGSGFIGRNLREGLQSEYNVLSPLRSELNLFDWQAIEKYIRINKIDLIIHAAVGKGDTVLSDTLRMFFAISRNANKVKKIINLGSGAEYAKTRDLIKVNEKEFGTYIPLDDYGFAKYICSHASCNYNNIITLRLFGIYGKYENYLMKFISNAIAKNIFGMPISIKQDVVFDYLYIDDFISIIKYVIKHNMKHQFYNVTPTESVSLSKIVKIINTLSKKKSRVQIVNKGMNYQYTGNNGRLLKELHNISFSSYKVGIKKLYDYYIHTKNLLDVKKLKDDVFFQIKQVK